MLQAIQDRVKALLEADDRDGNPSWFSGTKVEILTEASGDIYYDIPAAVAKVNGGVCVQVMTPILTPAEIDAQNSPKVGIKCGVIIMVFESPIMTDESANKTVAGALPRIIQRLHSQWCGVGSERSTANAGNRFRFDGGQDVSIEGLSTYELDFQATINLQLDQLPIPSGS